MAPKFPSPHNLIFLIRRHRRTGEASALRMAEKTLQAMRRGGIYDHVGFGFHRCSTDAEWLAPHFEKMLYDQADLATAYVEAYQATGTEEYARTAREVFTYVLRDMTGPEGGFYTAEDADSEGVEGKFYVWTRDEILQVLGPENGALFAETYGVAAEGNYRDEATRKTTGANILHLEPAPAEWTQAPSQSRSEPASGLETSRRRLFERRKKRVHPYKDDKVITAWNGLMITALARGSQALGEAEYARAAGRAAGFILSKMRRDGRLLRRFRDGQAAIPAFAEDYVFLARGLLDLYQATFDPARLQQAVELASDSVELFWDEAAGGLFDTGADAEVLVLRPKEVYDGATPSPNSVALEVFARLALLTGDPTWTERAEGVLRAFSKSVGDYPAAYAHFLQGAELLLETTREVVIAGNPTGEDTQALIRVLQRSYAPETVALLRSPEDPGGTLAALAPFTSGMKPVGGKAAAYVCRNFACQAPVTDPRVLAAKLAGAPTSR